MRERATSAFVDHGIIGQGRNSSQWGGEAVVAGLRVSAPQAKESNCTHRSVVPTTGRVCLSSLIPKSCAHKSPPQLECFVTPCEQNVESKSSRHRTRPPTILSSLDSGMNDIEKARLLPNENAATDSAEEPNVWCLSRVRIPGSTASSRVMGRPEPPPSTTIRPSYHHDRLRPRRAACTIPGSQNHARVPASSNDRAEQVAHPR